jgi:DNA helicase-2/ATP-dependent DNA helicase PcrA
MARRFVIKSDDSFDPSQLTIDYREELNPQQMAAVTAGGGASLVIAGAGTGKTRTLVYRLAYLVERGVPAERIVLLTFTRRASREMIERAASLLDGRCRRVEGGTFHSFCLGILKRYASRLGYPANFTVLDESDSADVINTIRTSLGFHRSEVRFPRKESLRSMFSSVVNRQIRLEDLLELEYPQYVAHTSDVSRVLRGYEQYKRDHGLMDYDDLLLRTRDLFERIDDVRRSVSGSCKHVLVDEYQDTNRVQADLVEYLSSVHGNVMVVGDDAQSIYRFRGADYRNLFDFPDRYADTTTYTLEHNYRSTQPILDLANRIIEQASRKFRKTLYTHKKGGELPGIVPAPDEQEESRFVAQMVLQLREEGIPLNEMAVLFRSGHNSFDLEVELNRRGIPFVKYGGIRLSEAAHIKDVLAHLRVIENPQDAVAWNRILLLLEGIGPKTASDLIEWIRGVEDPFAGQPVFASGRFVEALARLFAVLAPLRAESVLLSEQVEKIVSYYEPMVERLYPSDASKRTNDLDYFVGLAQSRTSRSAFINELTLDPIEFTTIEGKANTRDEPPLVLSTIHSAKGLEFHTVFVIQALDGIIPSSYSLGDAEGLDEELRLLYVAATRAETNLLVSYPQVQYRRSSGDILTSPSRFISDIPEKYLEPWELVSEK